MVVVAEKVSSWLLSFNQPSPPALTKPYLPNSAAVSNRTNTKIFVSYRISSNNSRRVDVVRALDPNSIGGGVDGISKKKVPSSNYVVPFDSSSCITRPLEEILRDLNKRIPDNIIIKPTTAIDQDGSEDDDGDGDHTSKTYIPWYHANRMLSFYAPGWCGEIRDVIFSDNGSVTVVYRVTIRGSDGEAHRESTGTVSPPMDSNVDAVAAAEEIAFCRACARFGLGLYLYHDE